MGLERLRADHRRFRERIKDLNDFLAEAASRFGTYGTLRLREAVEFLVSEVLTHQRSEEEGLFPILKERLPEKVALLASLKAEHQDLSQLTDELAQMAWRRRLGLVTLKEALEPLRAITSLLLDHITREEELLFPLAETVLKPDEGMTRLMGEMRQSEREKVPTEEGLIALNDRIHAELEELLSRHLEALTALDLEGAQALWQRFTDAIERHADAEEKFAVPAYERLGQFPEGGAPSLFAAEHNGIRRLVRRIGEELKGFCSTDPSLRRKVVLALDRYFLLRHLLEHHSLRERHLLYPHLERHADEVTKAKVGQALKEAWESGRGG